MFSPAGRKLVLLQVKRAKERGLDSTELATIIENGLANIPGSPGSPHSPSGKKGGGGGANKKKPVRSNVKNPVITNQILSRLLRGEGNGTREDPKVLQEVTTRIMESTIRYEDYTVI